LYKAAGLAGSFFLFNMDPRINKERNEEDTPLRVVRREEGLIGCWRTRRLQRINANGGEEYFIVLFVLMPPLRSASREEGLIGH